LDHTILATELRARIAKPSDREDLVELCKRAVGEDDYVIPRLDSVIQRKGLLAVFRGARIVAMSNFTQAIDGTAWLGMARTDPDFRGQGIAQFMQRETADYVRKIGIDTMRFWILSTNRSSIRAAEKGNFRAVGEAARISISLPKRVSAAATFQGRPHPLNLRDIEKSSYINKMSGFFCYHHCFAKMNKTVLEKLKGETYSNRTGQAFLFSRPETGQAYGEFSLLLGSARMLFYDVIRHSISSSVSELGGFVPFDHALIKTARQCGFSLTRWGRHAIIFEKKI
jgi:GNAT superfamily N-acetyltransferase